MLFPASTSGVPFQPSTDPNVLHATEQRPVFRTDDRQVFRSEAKQAGAFNDYFVKTAPHEALPALAMGQGLPTAAVMQAADAVALGRPAMERLDIQKRTLGIDAGKVLDNDYGNVKDPRGSFHRFGKIAQTWYAGATGMGMPQALAQSQDIAKVVALENKNRIGEVTRLTYRAGQSGAKGGADTGHELKNSLQNIGSNPTDVLARPKMADEGEKQRGTAALQAAADAQKSALDQIAKARAGIAPPAAAPPAAAAPVPPSAAAAPVQSAYVSGFTTAF